MFSRSRVAAYSLDSLSIIATVIQFEASVVNTCVSYRSNDKNREYTNVQ